MFSFFQISCLVIFVVSIIFGLLVFLSNRKSRVNLFWFLTSLSISVWSIGFFGVIFTISPRVAWFSQYFLDIGGILIPIFFFNFISNLIGVSEKRKIIRKIFYIGAIFLVLLNFTPLFKVGMQQALSFNYWVKPGPLYFLFPSFFGILFLYSFVLLKKHYKKEKNEIVRMQIKYIMWALIFGVGGGVTNFFPQLFNVYPFGNYLVVLYIVFISYAILKHHLFNVKVIATEIFTLAIFIVLLIKILLSQNFNELIINCLIFISITLFGVLLIRSVQKEVQQREHIQRLYEQVDRLSKAKSEFIFIASHQLRTPLTSIRGYVDLLLAGDFGKVAEENKQPLERIGAINQGMINLVNDLLDISRIEAGTLQLEIKQVNLEKIVDSIVKEMKVKAAEKNLALHWEKITTLPEIMADAGKIKQVILNLVDNAIKYTEKGEVIIKTETKKPSEKYQQGSILIAVQDTGPGLSKEELSRLFESYTRGEAGKKYGPGGLGLGLYVAKKFAEIHGGGVWAESEGLGKGSTFYVELPLK